MVNSFQNINLTYAYRARENFKQLRQTETHTNKTFTQLAVLFFFLTFRPVINVAKISYIS